MGLPPKVPWRGYIREPMSDLSEHSCRDGLRWTAKARVGTTDHLQPGWHSVVADKRAGEIVVFFLSDDGPSAAMAEIYKPESDWPHS
jgi:hypothetical protein